VSFQMLIVEDGRDERRGRCVDDAEDSSIRTRVCDLAYGDLNYALAVVMGCNSRGGTVQRVRSCLDSLQATWW
jgi:hypothetical protein